MSSHSKDAEQPWAVGSDKSYRQNAQTDGLQSAKWPNKRRRIALACSNCRHRKSRCDGGRPKCSLCSEIGCECSYEQAGTTTNLTVGRSYLSQLEQRLEYMEHNIRQLQQAQSLSQPNNANSMHTGTSTLSQRQEISAGDSQVSPETQPQLIYPTNPEMGEIDASEDAIDGMGAIKFTDEEDCGFFGPSSNIAFLRHISLALTQANKSQQGKPSPDYSRTTTDWMRVSRPHYVPGTNKNTTYNHSENGVNIYMLPPETRAWTLIKEYFQKTGQLLPFVHEESFCETYFQMKRTNFTMARRTWLGLLNIILAMACTLTVDGYASAEERIQESDIYYQRANGLCERESRRNISLELVQYLLILGQYLQGTQKSVQAWTVHGLATTTAFQLGLHSPRANRDFPPLECEIRKRVWFGCILLDRTLSMTFGRPCIIPEKYVKLELPSAAIQMMGQTSQNFTSPHADAMYYQATITLYNVMYQIIDTCYEQNLGLEESHLDDTIVALTLKGDRQLDEWKYATVPPLSLRVYEAPLSAHDLDNFEAKDKTVHRFNLVLSLRFHNLRILNHRPILEKFLDTHRSNSNNSGSKGMMHQVCVGSIKTCVDSAMIIISIVHTVVLSDGWRRDLLGAWNYSLFYTFNAGLVLLAALLVSPKEEAQTNTSDWQFLENATIYFNMAIEALQKLDHGNRLVQRISDYLSQMAVAVLSLPSTNLDPSLVLPRTGNIDKSAVINNSQQNQSQALSAEASKQVPSYQQNGLPVDIDLSEFMLDTDLDFFGGIFDSNKQFEGPSIV